MFTLSSHWFLLFFLIKNRGEIQQSQPLHYGVPSLKPCSWQVHKYAHPTLTSIDSLGGIVWLRCCSFYEISYYKPCRLLLAWGRQEECPWAGRCMWLCLSTKMLLVGISGRKRCRASPPPTLNNWTFSLLVLLGWFWISHPCCYGTTSSIARVFGTKRTCNTSLLFVPFSLLCTNFVL